jgi:hypothetical protein
MCTKMLNGSGLGYEIDRGVLDNLTERVER